MVHCAEQIADWEHQQLHFCFLLHTAMQEACWWVHEETGNMECPVKTQKDNAGFLPFSSSSLWDPGLWDGALHVEDESLFLSHRRTLLGVIEKAQR